jgi:LysR family glycine cleavage system transcriptional activator
MAWRWLSPTASRLRPSFPSVSIHAYQEGRAVDLAGADFAILPGDRLPAAGFERTPLYDERLLPVCSPALAAQARLETPARLARASLLVERPELWRRWFAQAGLTTAPDLDGPIIADASLALEAALRGQGVALCCSLAAAAGIAQGELVAPVDVSVGSGRRWWAVWREDSAADQTTMGILEWCLAELHAIQTRHVELA